MKEALRIIVRNLVIGSSLAAILAVAGVCQAATGHFVVEGAAKDVQVIGREWKAGNGSLVCSGTGNLLLAGKQCGPGDFTVTARLTIEQLAKSAATFMIDSSHFGFDGQEGKMFTDGAVFGGKQFLGPAVFKDGQPFDFQATRRGGKLTIEIDGKTVVTGSLDASATAQFGFRPWRSTMRIAGFSATGDLRDAPKLPADQPVFVPGKEGYPRYRIPAGVVTTKGTLLAFCEGRTGGDSGDIDLVLKRSTDGGKTWGPLQVVWNAGGNTCGNPAPVVDLETGTIWLLLTWNLGTDHERTIMAGTSKDVRHVYVTHSDDDGLTWAKPQKISDTTRQPHWRWYATGPVNGIQLTRGAHKGRLLIPANHSDHGQGGHPYRSHVIYSDDHGKSWKLGGIEEDRTNESSVAELSDGSVLQAMRSYHGKNRRAMAVSRDGGSTWGKVYLDQALDTPVCQASLLRFSWPENAAQGGKSRLLFASPAGSTRARMTVWLSYDEGKTWPVRKLIHGGDSAYSNLLALPDGRIGLLYEKDGYKTITLATFDLAWLE